MRTLGKAFLLTIGSLVTVVGVVDVLLRVTVGPGLFAYTEPTEEYVARVRSSVDAKVVVERNEESTVQVRVPVRIQIPRIGVDAPVESVGVNGRGAMAVPSVYTAVAWYKHGPAPGESGNAILAGHLDNSRGTPAVFAQLKNLRRGDRIYVSGKDNNVLTFAVTGSELYVYTDSPGDAVFTSMGDAQLLLITCEGEWDPVAKSYDKRRVVYAKPL